MVVGTTILSDKTHPWRIGILPSSQKQNNSRSKTSQIKLSKFDLFYSKKNINIYASDLNTFTIKIYFMINLIMILI